MIPIRCSEKKQNLIVPFAQLLRRQLSQVLNIEFLLPGSLIGHIQVPG